MNIAGNPRGLSIKPLRAGGVGNDEKFVDGDSAGAAALELSFFSTPPNYELSLDEFEELALARLKVRIWCVMAFAVYINEICIHHRAA